MTEGRIIRRNLLRNRWRTLLMLACITIAFAIYGVLGSVSSAFQLKDQLSANDRLMVINRNGFMQTLPIAYASQVAQIEGVAVASPVRLTLAYWREPHDIMTVAMVAPETFLSLSSEIALDAAGRDAFISQRDGLLVGKSMAARHGWKVGDRVTLQAFNDLRDDGSRSWQFTVAAIYTAAKPGGAENGMAAHYAYFNEALMAGRDRISWIIVKGRDAAINDAIARSIDAGFANSAAPTKTQSEAALARAFLEQLGEIVTIINLVVGAAFVIILMVVGNTMVFAINERTREIGVLRTLGFSRTRVVRIVAAEVAALAALGGGIGLALAYGVVGAIGTATKDILPGLTLTGEVLGVGLGLIALLALLTGLVPTLKAGRLEIIDALGRQ